jgi:ATP-dependent protease ClpP protease subunit
MDVVNPTLQSLVTLHPRDISPSSSDESEHWTINLSTVCYSHNDNTVRTITFHGDIVPASIARLIQIFGGILQEHQNGCVIKLIINSSGGLTVAVGMFRDYLKTLKYLTFPFELHTVGECIASAAVMLWLTGSRRFIIDGCNTIIHSQFSTLNNCIDTSQRAKAGNDCANMRMAKFLGKYSDYAPNTWMKVIFDTQDDAHIIPEHMVKIGLAHGVIKLLC